ncbi:MAG: multicopper oxidase domain-containing protein [Bacteroidia bacterium]
MWNFVLNTGGTVNCHDYEPDYFTVNGKSYPDLQADTTAIIKANVGQTIRLVISNTGLHKHSIHFHGYHLEILYSTKFPAHVGRVKDSFPIDPYESLILELTPEKPGTFPVHDHNLVAVTGAGEYPNGMIGFITIQ